MRGRLFCSRGVRGLKSPPPRRSAPSPPLGRGRRVSLAHSRVREKKGRRRRDPSPLRRGRRCRRRMRGRVFWSRGCEVKSPPPSAFGTFSPAAAGEKGLVGTLAGARKKKGVVGEILLPSVRGEKVPQADEGSPVLLAGRARYKESPSSAFGTFSPAGAGAKGPVGPL